MMNFRLIRHLWLFLAVAEERNFGRAAARLGMSQPPLTEQIQVLEQALKVKLFERSRRGAQLTAAGAAILPAVRKFSAQMESLELAVREAVAGHGTLLTIGAITSAMLDPLPQLVAKLRAAYPDITVSVKEIDSMEAVEALESGDPDLAFARLEGDLGPNVKTSALAVDVLAVAMPSGHRLATKPRIRMADLADEGFVMFPRKVSPTYYDSLVSSCRSHGFTPRVLHEARSVASQIALVGCGQGIALVPSRLKKLAADAVVFRPLKERIGVVPTALAWNSARANPAVDAAVAILGNGKLPN